MNFLILWKVWEIGKIRLMKSLGTVMMISVFIVKMWKHIFYFRSKSWRIYLLVRCNVSQHCCSSCIFFLARYKIVRVWFDFSFGTGYCIHWTDTKILETNIRYPNGAKRKKKIIDYQCIKFMAKKNIYMSIKHSFLIPTW